MRPVKTVVLGPRPAVLDELIERRRRLGLDRYDEVWEGSYHVSPEANIAQGLLQALLPVVLHTRVRAAGLIMSGPFNLGQPKDFRVPDAGFHRGQPQGVWIAGAAGVVEILSRHDESYEKFGFYARRGVEEILIVDPAARTVQFWRRTSDEGYERAPASNLLGISGDELTAAVEWPDLGDDPQAVA